MSIFVLTFQIDLLSAARCNLFSYSLATYQNNWITLLQKNQEVLEAHLRIIENEPKVKHNFGILKDLAQEVNSCNSDEPAQPPSSSSNTAQPVSELNDNDQRLFFGEEFSDAENKIDNESRLASKIESRQHESEKLIDYEAFDEFMMSSNNIPLPSQLLMDDSLFTNENLDLLSSLVPSQSPNCELLAASTNNNSKENNNNNNLNKNPSKKASDVSKWFQLFSELDPLNQQKEVNDANENMHAA